jgi:hypothetical protein
MGMVGQNGVFISTSRLEYTSARRRQKPPVLHVRAIYLQSILEQLVHLGHLGRDGQIDGAVGNLDDEAALDLRVDLGDDLELLAGGDVVGLVDGGFETAESPVVKGLCDVLVITFTAIPRVL